MIDRRQDQLILGGTEGFQPDRSSEAPLRAALIGGRKVIEMMPRPEKGRFVVGPMLSRLCTCKLLNAIQFVIAIESLRRLEH